MQENKTVSNPATALFAHTSLSIVMLGFLSLDDRARIAATCRAFPEKIARAMHVYEGKWWMSGDKKLPPRQVPFDQTTFVKKTLRTISDVARGIAFDGHKTLFPKREYFGLTESRDERYLDGIATEIRRRLKQALPLALPALRFAIEFGLSDQLLSIIMYPNQTSVVGGKKSEYGHTDYFFQAVDHTFIHAMTSEASQLFATRLCQDPPSTTFDPAREKMLATVLCLALQNMIVVPRSADKHVDLVQRLLSSSCSSDYICMLYKSCVAHVTKLSKAEKIYTCTDYDSENDLSFLFVYAYARLDDARAKHRETLVTRLYAKGDAWYGHMIGALKYKWSWTQQDLLPGGSIERICRVAHPEDKEQAAEMAIYLKTYVRIHGSSNGKLILDKVDWDQLWATNQVSITEAFDSLGNAFDRSIPTVNALLASVQKLLADRGALPIRLASQLDKFVAKATKYEWPRKP